MSIEKFGKFIAEERKKKALTQDQLAAVLGISGKAVSKWERGLNYPDIALLEKLALTLEVTIAELLKGQKNVPDETVSIEQVDQAVSDTLTFSKRIMMRQRKGFILALSLIIITSVISLTYLQTDTQAPVILDAILIGDEIRINATDNQGDLSYLVSINTNKPVLDDSRWSTSNIIQVKDSGVYMIWVKDKADHLVNMDYTLIYTSKADQQIWVDTMFSHLTWADLATGKVTVNSEIYDLDALREKYGDLYWFVEPLSLGNFNQRTEYMSWWSMVFPKEGEWDPYTGLKKSIMVDSMIDARVQEVYKILKTSTDEKLNKYASLIHYDSKLNRYSLTLAEGLDCRISVLCLGFEYNAIDYLSLDLYLRTFIFIYEKKMAAYKELDLDLHHYWEQQP